MRHETVTIRPVGIVSMLQRVVDGVATSDLGAHPIVVLGIGRNPKTWDQRCYFDVEDPDLPTVRIRAWIEGKKLPEWNHLIKVSALVRFKVKKPGVTIEPELEVLGVEETLATATSRDDLRVKFAAAMQHAKASVIEVFLKDKPRLVLVTNQAGEADRDIRSQLSGYEDLLSIEVMPVKMTSPESVAKALREVQHKAGVVDVVALVRGGGDGITALEHESVLQAVSERVIPLVTAIGHASHHTLVDEMADLAFPVPTALGRWLREQLEAKARRAADQKRLSDLKIEEEFRKALGKLEALEKERQQDRARSIEVDKERMKERATLIETEKVVSALREERAALLSDRWRWKGLAWIAIVGLGVLVVSKVLGVW